MPRDPSRRSDYLLVERRRLAAMEAVVLGARLVLERADEDHLFGLTVALRELDRLEAEARKRREETR